MIDSAARAEGLLARFVELLEERKTGRARVRQTVHLVWDIDSSLPEEMKLDLERLAHATGFSLFVSGSRS